MKTERPSFATLLITYGIKLCEYWHRGTVWQFITTFEKELKSYGSNISNEPTLWFWTNMFFAHMTPFLKKIIECKLVPKTWKFSWVLTFSQVTSIPKLREFPPTVSSQNEVKHEKSEKWGKRIGHLFWNCSWPMGPNTMQIHIQVQYGCGQLPPEKNWNPTGQTWAMAVPSSKNCEFWPILEKTIF